MSMALPPATKIGDRRGPGDPAGKPAAVQRLQTLVALRPCRARGDRDRRSINTSERILTLCLGGIGDTVQVLAAVAARVRTPTAPPPRVRGGRQMFTNVSDVSLPVVRPPAQQGVLS